MDTMESLQQKECFTCLTCKVKFTNLAIFKDHYRSEWHKYNIRVTINGLPSITLEDFQKKEAIYRENTANHTKGKHTCKVCRKKFSSQKQYENHLASKTHKNKLEQNDKNILDETRLSKSMSIENMSTENEKEIETDSEVESLDSDEWLEDSKYHIYENNCLFCDCHASSITCIMRHMTNKHSFFVPDLEYCVDLAGLLEYLEQKICTEFKCIWCNDSGRKMRSANAVKMHMIDKGHCKMLFEGETMLEYSSFYDYSSSYPVDENGDSVVDEELPVIPPEILDDGSYTMMLPSGKMIVHRDLAFYYKQNLPVDHKVTIKGFNHWLKKRLFKEISLGDEKEKLEANRLAVRDTRNFQRIQAKYSTQLQVKQNKLQQHFRQQTKF
ncbi:zinc finger protein 622 [Monomorium pharaonis]|uniref:zinc finger protein 622 n=1 Tax=Monomorium pharaonis TaxID=307658 RepID=UPI0017476BE5|nr:zinc finger protein 622 [Monomorium pharaonis]